MASDQPYVEMEGRGSGLSNLLQLDGMNFKKLARKLSICLVVAMIFVPVLLNEFASITNLPNFIAHISAGVVVGILELPFCFTTMTFCKRLQSSLTLFEVYWLRGLLYIAIGVSLGAINQL
eukprot:CAMPEP_0173421146 /NCGR_PEP_ID=MMETSP1357-20121228/2372_1 /TAXON_ID=77926 /ORGANISM="Hemiselmis rufescens, Strain PCC563" /LENGTH=120 /DNA_ID=CAMNT_0014384029 /DNA_START=31 /DNA_END=390 /DNA_ORIENTATION=+